MMYRMRAALCTLCFICLISTFASAEGTVSLRLSTSQRAFAVEGFTLPGGQPRPAVLILSGSRGYKSDAYRLLAAALNAAGIDAFLIHYMSDADDAKIHTTTVASERTAYYAERMPDWIATIRVTIEALCQQPIYHSKIGVFGISLGAMPVAVASTTSSTIAATTIVDGNFPEGFKSAIRTLPPLLLVWGTDDRVFPLSTGIKLRDLAQSIGTAAELHTFPGEGHGFFLAQQNAHASEARSDVVEFFSRQLK